MTYQIASKNKGRWSPAGMVLTPGRAGYVIAFWLLGPIAHLFSSRPYAATAYVVIYTGYFLSAALVLAYEYWPRHNPAAEGLRRAYRLLPVDPGMALVRGRGALEYALREAAEGTGVAVENTDGALGIHDLLLALHNKIPADLYSAADQLRRLGNEAAHDPDWHTDREKARAALQAAARMYRWSRKAARR